MKCNHCGAEIADDSVFCESCGKKIGEANTPKNDSKKKLTLWIGIAAAAVIAIVLAIVLFGGGGDSPKSDEELNTEEKIDSTSYNNENTEVETNVTNNKPSLSETERQSLIAIGYVDLGLPSGTLWKDQNEDGFYSYSDAVRRFGSDFIPTKENLEELKTYCKWEHGGKNRGTSGSSIYYKVTGPNGNHIILQTPGIKQPNNEIYMKGYRGFIYASSPDDSYEYYALVYSRVKIDGVDSDYISVTPCRDDGYQYSVRLAR